MKNGIERSAASANSPEGPITAVDGVPYRRVRDVRQSALERRAQAGQPHGGDCGRRPEGLEFEAVSQKVARLVALCGAELRINQVRKDPHDRDTRMELEILANLTGAVGEVAAFLKQYRRG